MIDPLAPRALAQFLVSGVDPELRLRHVERLTRGLMEKIEKDPHKLSVVDLVSALAEIATEAKLRR